MEGCVCEVLTVVHLVIWVTSRGNVVGLVILFASARITVYRFLVRRKSCSKRARVTPQISNRYVLHGVVSIVYEVKGCVLTLTDNSIIIYLVEQRNPSSLFTLLKGRLHCVVSFWVNEECKQLIDWYLITK